MTSVGQPERVTQNRVIALFRDPLGYVGDWTDRDGNNNIEDGRLSAWLAKCGYAPGPDQSSLGVVFWILRSKIVSGSDRVSRKPGSATSKEPC